MSNDPYSQQDPVPEKKGLRKIQVPAGDYTEPVGKPEQGTPQRNHGPGGVPVRKPTPEILAQMRDLEEALVKQENEVEGSVGEPPEEEEEGRVELDEVPEDLSRCMTSTWART